jgi:hypothetical protein
VSALGTREYTLQRILTCGDVPSGLLQTPHAATRSGTDLLRLPVTPNQ